MENRDLLSRVAERFATRAPRPSPRTPIGSVSLKPIDSANGCIVIPCIFESVTFAAPPSGRTPSSSP